MVVDSSALVAILFGEPEAARFKAAIAGANTPVVSAVAFVEVAMVALSRRGFTAHEVEQRLSQMGLAILPVTVVTARHAADAFARYGKGRHPAALNFGDCFAYALAKERGEPLLFEGGDFARTDVEAA
jgi:ribonuclease VapC